MLCHCSSDVIISWRWQISATLKLCQFIQEFISIRLCFLSYTFYTGLLISPDNHLVELIKWVATCCVILPHNKINVINTSYLPEMASLCNPKIVSIHQFTQVSFLNTLSISQGTKTSAIYIPDNLFIEFVKWYHRFISAISSQLGCHTCLLSTRDGQSSDTE